MKQEAMYETVSVFQPLTQQQVSEREQALGALAMERRQLEEERKQLLAAWKERAQPVLDRMDGLAAELDAGGVHVDVECSVHVDVERGVVDYVSVATGEVVRTDEREQA